MNIALWVVQGLVAFAFVATAGMKLAQSKEKLIGNPQMAWANDFSGTQTKLIALAEVLGAEGLIAPWLTGILPILTPLAALCGAILMGGAAATHLRRKEPVILSVLALIIAGGRGSAFL